MTYHPLPTPREQEIAQLIADGLQTAEIAAKLGRSEHTVRTHRTSMMRRMGAHTAGQLIAIGFRSGWLK